MKRTKLRNKFLKERTDESKKRYTSQRNYCVSLLKKTKKNYYNSLNKKDVSDFKTFWTVKPFLSDKIVSKEQILLVENDEIISEDNKIAESLNSFFSNIAKNLKIPGYRPHNYSLFEKVSDPILKVILKYRNYPSILTIGEVCKNKSNKQPLFSFSQATWDETLKEILSLDTTKTCQDTDIPTKILKENADTFSDFLFAYYNASVVNSSKFPSILTLADIIPVFKKGDKEYKNNHRPVNILPNMSKIFERIIFRQISNYMESFLLKY